MGRDKGRTWELWKGLIQWQWCAPDLSPTFCILPLFSPKDLHQIQRRPICRVRGLETNKLIGIYFPLQNLCIPNQPTPPLDCARFSTFHFSVVVGGWEKERIGPMYLVAEPFLFCLSPQSMYGPWFVYIPLLPKHSKMCKFVHVCLSVT